MTAKAGVVSRIAVGDATNAMTLISFDSESLQETRGVIVNNGIRGTRAHYIERVRNGEIAVGGNLTFTPQSNEWEFILPKILAKIVRMYDFGYLYEFEAQPSGIKYIGTPMAVRLERFKLNLEQVLG